jgi:hypothetical protein
LPSPNGVEGAVILYHVGEQAPDDPSQWMFARLATRIAFDFRVPMPHAAGSRVWLAARWHNRRGECGPTSSAEATRISEGLALAA